MTAAIAAVVVVACVVTMAIDHLIGTESEPGETQSAEPIAFVTSTALALGLTAVLFYFVVGRASRRPERIATKAIVCSVLGVVTVPLLFVAVPFPFAGAGIALGLMDRSRLSRVAVVIGVLVLALGVGAYVAAAL